MRRRVNIVGNDERGDMDSVIFPQQRSVSRTIFGKGHVTSRTIFNKQLVINIFLHSNPFSYAFPRINASRAMRVYRPLRICDFKYTARSSASTAGSTESTLGSGSISIMFLLAYWSRS